MSAGTDCLETIQDLIRWGASQFNAAELHFGHGTDNALDEAAWLAAGALSLPIEQLTTFATCRLTPDERETILGLYHQRIQERRPAAYLLGHARFAGLEFIVDDQVLIPRSPLAELMTEGFAPWVDPDRIERVLDLCTGSGCIGLAAAHHLPQADVDLSDISSAALRLAARNRSLHELDERVHLIESDLFAGIGDRSYEVIVSNPPYVGAEEMESLPPEYRHEPRLALAAGETGLDLVLRILRDAPDYLTDEGVLIVEVGNTAETLEDRFPQIAFTWIDFAQGGEGVFIFSRDELIRYHEAFSHALAAL